MGIKIKEWDIVWGINVTTIYSNPGYRDSLILPLKGDGGGEF